MPRANRSGRGATMREKCSATRCLQTAQVIMKVHTTDGPVCVAGCAGHLDRLEGVLRGIRRALTPKRKSRRKAK